MLKIDISGSKSESNRALILQSYWPNLVLKNTSNSDDSQLMEKALLGLNQNTPELYCGHAGTVIRFLLARTVFKPNYKGLIFGSKRLLSRPISPLIDALKPFAKSIVQTSNGIEIESLSSFPDKGIFTINASLSSQFVSALCLCAPAFKSGVEIKLEGKISSRPYIEMTLAFLKQMGYSCIFTASSIVISTENTLLNKGTFYIEPDWSSLSYWFSYAAISKQSINLPNYKKQSLQADAAIANFAAHFGLVFNFTETGLEILADKAPSKQAFNADFDACPDIAPTFMALCAALKVPCKLTGLHSLKVKESDRIVCMANNLKKLGYKSIISDTTFEIIEYSKAINYDNTATINTDLDHRIAMSFAPLLHIFPNISFDDKTVVNKSYPNFWNDFNTATSIKI